MGRRLEKINSLIKEELSKIIQKIVDFPKGTLVTLTRVITTEDLRECKVFFSCYPEKNFDEILKILEKEIYFIQKNLNQRLVLKKIPKIKFAKEQKLVEADKIDKILEKLKKEKNKVKY
jgi:ribosome-binding factor A